MKKILINAFSAKIGGGQTYIKNLLARLPCDDFTVYVFAPDDILIPPDRRVVRLTTRYPVNNPIARLFWERCVLPTILKQLSVDILFCPGGVVNTWVPPGCRIVTMFQNMLPFDKQVLNAINSPKLRVKNWLLKRSMLSSMCRADLVVFISEYARSIIESHIIVKKALTIPHGIPEGFLVHELDLKRPSLPFVGRYILYVSRFEPYKRHMELICAYAMLPSSVRAIYKLLIVGGYDTPWGDNAKKRILELGLENQVVMLGEYPYQDLPALYKNASLLVFVSVCENCPTILLEAMGAGVPILCSDYQPMPEFGGDGVYYVSPDKVESIYNGIVNVFGNCDLADDLSNKAIHRASMFRMDRAAQKTWSAILSL